MTYTCSLSSALIYRVIFQLMYSYVVLLLLQEVSSISFVLIIYCDSVGLNNSENVGAAPPGCTLRSGNKDCDVRFTFCSSTWDPLVSWPYSGSSSKQANSGLAHILIKFWPTLAGGLYPEFWVHCISECRRYLYFSSAKQRECSDSWNNKIRICKSTNSIGNLSR
jgi:hypothetical protein